MTLLRTLSLIMIIGFHYASLSAQNWKFQSGNKIEARSFLNFQHADNSQNIHEFKSSHDFKLSYKTAFQMNVTARSIWNSSNSDRSRLLLNEAHIALNKGIFNFKVGKQIIKWGSLTGISNADLANRYDYFDFLDNEDEELGQWALMTKIGNAKTQLQLRYVPNTQHSSLYISDNNWAKLPTHISLHEQATATIPVVFRGLISDSTEGNKASFDLNFKTEHKNISLGISYFQGQNDFLMKQILVDRSSLQLPLQYDIQLSTSDLSMINLNIQYLLGEWSLWSELGYIQNQMMSSENAVVDDHYWSFTYGMDRIFLFENPAQILKLLVQWKHTLWNDEASYRATDIDHVLDRCFILDLDFKLGYHWSVAMKSAMSYDKYGSYLRPSVAWKSDHWGLEGALDMMNGTEDHFFGYYQDNTRLSLKLIYKL